MSGQELLNLFLCAHILILLAAALSATLRFATQKGWIQISAKDELRLNHALVVLVLILPIVAAQITNRFHFQPVAKTYSAATFNEFDSKANIDANQKLIIGSYKHSHATSIKNIEGIALLFLALTLLAAFVQIIKEVRYLKSILSQSFHYKSHGKVRIAFSDKTKVPFSLRTFNFAWTILPTSFAMAPSKMQMSISHEFQHHRQRDTTWLFLFQGMKAVAGINPALHAWLKIMGEIQELKVDENLVDQGKVEPREYARCLIEVAESVVRGERQLVCAAGLAFWPDRQLLKRRIEFMFKEKERAHYKVL